MTIRQDYIDKLIALANEFGPEFGINPVDAGMFAEAPPVAAVEAPRERMGAPDWLREQHATVREGPLQPGQAFFNPLQPVIDTAKLAAEFTGVPAMVRGADNVAQGVDQGDGLRALAGVGEMGLGALPGASVVRAAAPVMRAVSGTVPRAIATTAALAAPGAMLGARDAQAQGASKAEAAVNSDPEVKRLREQVATIERNLARGEQAKTGMNQRSADASRERESAAWNTMLNGSTAPNGTAIPGLRQRLMDAEARARDAYMATAPFRERYPTAAAALPVAGLAAGAGLPFALRATANAYTGLPWSQAQRLNTEIARGQKALTSPNATQGERDLAENTLNAFVKREPSALGRTWAGVAKPVAAGVAGGMLAAEGQMLPDQFDWYNLPAGPAKDAARAAALDAETFIKRAAIGSLLGLSGYKAGDLVPRLDPNWPAAIGTRDALRVRGASGGGSGAPPPPPPSGSQSGSGTVPLPPPSPTPGTAVSPPLPPANAFAHYDTNVHGPVSRQQVGEFLNTMPPKYFTETSPKDIAKDLVYGRNGIGPLADRFAMSKSPIPASSFDPDVLMQRAMGTANIIHGQHQGLVKANRSVTNPDQQPIVLATSTGKPYTLALPAAVAAGAAAEDIKGHWQAQPRGDDGRFDGPPDPKKWKPRSGE